MRVGIVGPYPPPTGGVSIHIKRLSYRLSKHNIQHTIFVRSEGNVVPSNDKILWIRSRSDWFSAFRRIKCDVLHVNTTLENKFGLFIKIFFRGPVLITLHGNDTEWPYAVNCLRPPDERIKGKISTMIRMKIIKDAAHVVCVNSMLRELLISRGVPATKVSVIPPYLQPTPDEITDLSDKRILDFLAYRWPIISINAFQLRFYEGRDLYGLDTAVELCSLLRRRYPRVGFLFCLPVIGEPNYLHKMRGLIASKGLEDNFLFVIGKPEEFYAILRASTVFIRPTLSDGYGLSINEALHFGVPAVASDVCPRPDGTLLYKIGDLQNLYERVAYAIEHRDELSAAIANQPETDYFTPLLNLYNKLAAGDGEV